ncbi:MAG TPA: MFS transporter [Methylomirabilota bacterium]
MSPWPVLVLLTLAHGAGAFAVLAVAPLAPFLVDTLRLSRVAAGFFLPAAYLGGVLMSLPAGWLTDRLGVRFTLSSGLGVIAVMIAVASALPGLPLFLACLVLAGFGFSVLNPATGRGIVEWFLPRRRGVAMGIKQTGLTLGGVAGALVLPSVAHAAGLRRALLVAAAVALVSGLVVALAYRAPAATTPVVAAPRPRLREVGAFLRRPGLLVVFGSGLALSVAQSSLLAYLALYAKETFGISAVAAAHLLALAQLGGTASRLAGGVVSDRYFGGRRRPGVVLTALIGAACYVAFAFGDTLPVMLVRALAFVAGIGAFGWVGLYFALVAEVGGARYAGVLTGVATMFAWSGMLVGPPLFGLVLELTQSYRAPWLALAVVGLAVAMTLPRPRPLVERAIHVAA